MKAVVVTEYGGPEVLKFGDFSDPAPGLSKEAAPQRSTGGSHRNGEGRRRQNPAGCIMPHGRCDLAAREALTTHG
jgi:hypothetical protein